jgi:hypothetical protein
MPHSCVVVLATTRSTLETLIVVGDLFICALMQHEWFCADGSFSAKTASTVSFFAAFLLLLLSGTGSTPVTIGSETFTMLGLGSISSFVDFIKNLIREITVLAMFDEGHVTNLDVIKAG